MFEKRKKSQPIEIGKKGTGKYTKLYSFAF